METIKNLKEKKIKTNKKMLKLREMFGNIVNNVRMQIHAK